MDTTEKSVEVQVVDESLPASQRIIDSRPASINLQEAVTPQRDEMRIRDEPHQWPDLDLQDIGLGFESDEEISSDTSVEK